MEKETWRKSNKTDTNFFLMPIFGIGKEMLKGMGYVESFIEDKHKAYPDDGKIRVFALFHPTTEGQRQRLKKELRDLDEKGLICDEYDYTDGYTVLVFQLPKGLEADYKLFLEGKYSKYSPKMKKLFPERELIMRKGVNIEDLTLQYHVFNKTPGIQKYWAEEFGLVSDVLEDPDQEFWYRPDPEREVLDINIYVKLDGSS